MPSKKKSRFIPHFYMVCWPLTLPITAVIIAATCLFCTGYETAAWAVSDLGTLVSVLFAVTYVLAVHSKSRWPDRHWTVRLLKLFTFSR